MRQSSAFPFLVRVVMGYSSPTKQDGQ
jgi:hypothetical protein